MHAHAHMSGQVSGKVPNQVPQHNGSLASMQSLGGLRNFGSMDPDFDLKRQAVRDRIYQILQQQPLTAAPEMQSRMKDIAKRLEECLYLHAASKRPLTAAPEMQPRMKDIAKRLEECLFKHAASKEDYLDMDTLETSLHSIISRIPPPNRGQQLPPLNSLPSSIGTMIPTPGIQRNRHALIGRAIDDNDMERVLHFLKNDPVVDALYDCKSEVIGPGFFRFKAEIDFNGVVVVQNYLQRTGRDKWAKQFREAGNDKDDSMLLNIMSNYGEEVVTALGSEVDRLEKEIQKLVPGIRHVEIKAHNPEKEIQKLVPVIRHVDIEAHNPKGPTP